MISKHLKKGFGLTWEGGTLTLRTAGEKIIPVVNAVSTATDVYDAVRGWRRFGKWPSGRPCNWPTHLGRSVLRVGSVTKTAPTGPPRSRLCAVAGMDGWR